MISLSNIFKKISDIMMRHYFKSMSFAQWLIIMDETLFRMLDILLQGAVSQNFLDSLSFLW